MNNILSKRLYQFPFKAKLLCFITILNLTIGVSIGLYYVYYTTQISIDGTTEHYRGSTIDDNFSIPEKYPKPLSELLNTTHTHILSMTFIFVILGSIFYFNSILTGFVKTFLIIEPFISILTTFGGIWLVRYLHPGFSYLIIVSGLLMYVSFFIMVAVILYELAIKRSN